jgi:hypothetical protein
VFSLFLLQETRALQHVPEAVVPFVARVLQHWPLDPIQRQHHRERLRIRGRVGDREAIVDPIRAVTSEALDRLRRLRRNLEPQGRLLVVVAGFDDQRLPFPPSA